MTIAHVYRITLRKLHKEYSTRTKSYTIKKRMNSIVSFVEFILDS